MLRRKSKVEARSFGVSLMQPSIDYFCWMLGVFMFRFLLGWACKKTLSPRSIPLFYSPDLVLEDTQRVLPHAVVELLVSL